MDPILRLLAPNPGPWTGEGTNSWLLGEDNLVLIDPGPDLPAHEAALVTAIAGRRVEAILVTHAHRDHSALAPRLSRVLGAPIWAAGDPHGAKTPRPDMVGGEGVDRDFRPDFALGDGQVLSLAGLRLRALHTPGHLGGHFCFALGDLLFSGDHVMGWSTSTVSPPEGDMAAYRASLARLASERWRLMLPGHGPEIPDPAARLAFLMAHRNDREAQVLDALRAGPALALDLVPRLYPGLDPALTRAAAGNVLAHLLQLEEEGRAHVLKPGASNPAESRFALGPGPRPP
ncbi:MBL fold metallo-hydrolase [Stagnihabitans tardus]|uniref:MBL fold metallo-hydrolase n=1 Tax=Stagnihabitans tardus TaxID=2699202 RepID=A0AAE4Y917_9RHOB|nr:MBL fold metallo-hydrolase [Stagnihabitans tardus]NBZ87444.1 MBL fold metallo-hydrolase [Stagnihabitans tardus]